MATVVDPDPRVHAWGGKQPRRVPWMPGDLVNLDALVPREDFLTTDGHEGAGASGKAEATQTDLVPGASFYSTLRKPDFQRETAAWTPQAVCDFIQAFIDDELIPSVICWQSPTRLSFVIDGAHRLSAIIAWLRDDYGDRDESIKFYDNKINEEQKRIADKTRQLVNKTVGAFVEYKAENANPGSNPSLTRRARALAHVRIPLLWIKSQEAKKAERAFRTINRAAVQIDPTELRILQTRFTPSAIAARAIVRKASGHKYWHTFTDAGQASVERLGQSIYALLYSPPLQAPIRTVELPIAGHGYGSQTLPLIFDLVNIASGYKVVDASKESWRPLTDDSVPTTPDEPGTIKALQRAEWLARLLSSTHSSSLGLHPAIYFYAANGRHQGTAVLATAQLVVDLERDDKLLEFALARAAFEDFLKDHKMFINQLTTQYGSMAKGYKRLYEYLSFVLRQFMSGPTNAEKVVVSVQAQNSFRKLIKDQPTKTDKSKPFSQDLKQWAFLKAALDTAILCPLCGARIDVKAMQLDHATDLKRGGLGDGDNAQWTHPYCNSIKDKIERRPSRGSYSTID